VCDEQGHVVRAALLAVRIGGSGWRDRRLRDAGGSAARPRHVVPDRGGDHDRGRWTAGRPRRRLPLGRLYDFFFAEPYHQFAITDPRDVLADRVLPGSGVADEPLDRTRSLGSRTSPATRASVDRAAKAKTEAIIESIDDGLVVLDRHGAVAHLNEVACAILDVDRSAALGRPFAELATSHPRYLRLRSAVAHLEDGEAMPAPVEIAMFLRGRDHFFSLRSTPLRSAEGDALGRILTLQDVTSLRDQEARREQLVATLSHELRTPLTSLRMAGDLLARSISPDGSNARPLIDAAREDVARLEDVAHRLLELSRSRATTIGLDREKIPMRLLVERGAGIFELQAREAGVSIETNWSRFPRSPATPPSSAGPSRT
jgi:PAS domain S-box-containing protein